MIHRIEKKIVLIAFLSLFPPKALYSQKGSSTHAQKKEMSYPKKAQEGFETIMGHYSTLKLVQSLSDIFHDIAHRNNLEVTSPSYDYALWYIASFMVYHLSIAQLSFFSKNASKLTSIMIPLLSTLYFAVRSKKGINTYMCLFLAIQAAGKIASLYAKIQFKKIKKSM